MGDNRYRRSREQYAPDGLQKDRLEILSKAAPTHAHTGPIEKRRQEDQHDNAGIELHFRKTRDERQQEAHAHQHDGMRHLQASRDDRAYRRYRNKRKAEKQDVNHETYKVNASPGTFATRFRGATLRGKIWQRPTLAEIGGVSWECDSKRRLSPAPVPA